MAIAINCNWQVFCLKLVCCCNVHYSPLVKGGQGGKEEFTPTTSGGVFQYTGAHSILFPISFHSADPYILVNIRDNPGFCSATATGNDKTGCVLNIAGLNKQYPVYYLAVGW